jgi:hypothetical protein
MESALLEKKMSHWTSEEKKNIPPQYGCELLFDRTTLDQVKDPSLPNDAYIVIYETEKQSFMDLCRGKRVNIFDMYYDKFGPGSVKKIDWGFGRVNPRNWGYKSNDAKKKK